MYISQVVTTEGQLAEMLVRLRKARLIAWDTEASSVDNLTADLAGISFSDGEYGWYVPVGHVRRIEDDTELVEGQLPLNVVLQAVKPILESEAIRKAAFNAPFDIGLLLRYGIKAKNHMDPQIFRWLLYCGSAHEHIYRGLKAEVAAVFDHQMQEITELIGDKGDQRPFNEVPVEEAYPYAIADAYWTWRLAMHWYGKFKESDKGMDVSVVRDAMTLAEVVADMHWRGVKIDVQAFERLREAWRVEVDSIMSELEAHAGFRVGVTSTKQLLRFLIETEGIPEAMFPKTAKGNLSASKGVLDQIDKQVENPWLRKIVRAKTLLHLIGSFIDPMMNLRDSMDSIHSTFDTRSASGRFRSSSPNLMNLPAHSEDGFSIKECFIARPGYVFLAADYSQIELRLLAHVSGDPFLREAYQTGQDLHTATAARVFSITTGKPVSLEEVTPQMRSAAKTVNFGLVYGMGAGGLSRTLGISFQEAVSFVDAYFGVMPLVRQFIHETRQHAMREGWTATIGGRRRYFHQLTAPDLDMKNGQTWNLLNAAVNHTIQGSAADLMRKAMCELYRLLPEYGAYQVLQVHDEIVVECPEAHKEAVQALMKEVMEGVWQLSVPLVAEAAIGYNLKEVK